MHNYKDLENFPFVAEAIAIDIANSLSGAEIGIRGFRNRGFLTRLWDGLTGKSDEYVAQITADLVVAQRAMAEYLKILAKSEIHTQKCLIKVTQNLLKVIDDAKELDAKIDNVRQQLDYKIRQVYASLNDRIDNVNFQIQREKELRRLTAKYEARTLYQGRDIILRSALYIAQVSNLYWGESIEVLTKEVNYARNIVKKNLSNESEIINNLISQSLQNTKEQLVPAVIYITSMSNGSLLKTYNLVFSKKYAGLSVQPIHIKESLIIAGTIANDTFLKQGEIYTPYQLSCELAKELTDEIII